VAADRSQFLRDRIGGRTLVERIGVPAALILVLLGLLAAQAHPDSASIRAAANARAILTVAAPLTASLDCPDCPIMTVPGDSLPLFVESKELGLVCHPARIAADEGRWTFLLRGPGGVGINGAALEIAGTEHKAIRIEAPTPNAVLVDFLLPVLTPGDQAQLILRAGRREIGRIPISVSGPASVPPGARQPHFVRLQMRENVFLYPLHSSGGYTAQDGRRLAEIGGDRHFHELLADMGIEWIRKIMSNIDEADSVQWDPRNHRELVYGGSQLRMYLVYLDPERSEEAFREIFRAFPQVEQAFVNSDPRARGRAGH